LRRYFRLFRDLHLRPTYLAVANAEYRKWIAGSQTPLQVSAAPSHQQYRPVRQSDQRVVLRNDIAVKAVAENHIDPWPDGAAFAKVAWK
jgi:hypothetical protein